MQYINFNNKIYDSFEKFSLSYIAMIFISTWAFFESSVWFILPDFIILILVVVNPTKYKKYFGITFISSILGILAYYLFVIINPTIAWNILVQTPFTTPLMVDQVATKYTTQGISSILFQSYSGIPSKIWTYTLTEIISMKFMLYFVLVSISRGVRIFITSFVASKIGIKGKQFIRNHFSILITLHTIIFFFVLFRIT